MQLIDLHVHSTASDGTLTPTEVTKLALQCGLTAYALTDHDTVDGVAEAMQAAENTSLTVIPGAEFSSPYEGKEIHILGLYLNPHCRNFYLHCGRSARSATGAMKSFSLYFRQMDFPLNMKI